MRTEQRLLYLAIVALAIVFAQIVTARAELKFPALTGYVVDEAGLLDASSRAMLTQKLQTLEAKSTDQLVVVTLTSLQGTSIEDFGLQLFNYWHVGRKEKNNGVLLIVAPNERRVRIEVGYGLEGTLTNATAKTIIEEAITPRFRANDFPGGIAHGVDEIIKVIADRAVDDVGKYQAGSEPKKTAARSTGFSNMSPNMSAAVLAFFFASLGIVLLFLHLTRSKTRTESGKGVQTGPKSTKNDLAEQPLKLANLHRAGELSDDEFKALKAKLISEKRDPQNSFGSAEAKSSEQPAGAASKHSAPHDERFFQQFLAKMDSVNSPWLGIAAIAVVLLLGWMIASTVTEQPQVRGKAVENSIVGREEIGVLAACRT